MTLYSGSYVLITTLGLIVQFAVLGLLLYGYQLKRASKFGEHARIMTSALTLHLAAIFAFMVPAFALARRIPRLALLLSVLHAPLGVAAVGLGLLLVVSWHRGGLQTCFSRRKFMVGAFSLWLTALALGIALYFVLYWVALTG